MTCARTWCFANVGVGLIFWVLARMQVRMRLRVRLCLGVSLVVRRDQLLCEVPHREQCGKPVIATELHTLAEDGICRLHTMSVLLAQRVITSHNGVTALVEQR